MDSRMRDTGRLGLSAGAHSPSSSVGLVLNILWDTVLSLYIANISISRQLHLCWLTSQSI